MKDLVSIVVPVYNAENFIDRCIDSLLNQTYKNIEILLIDDGSTDNSLNIIKEYEKNNKNIKVYSHKNKGPGPTRNDGIKFSKGRYITFVDSDDYIDNDYVELLVNNITDNDIIVTGYKLRNSDLKLKGRVVPKITSFDPFKFTSTCCKLYKRDLLIKNDIKFDNILIGEDIYFSLKCYSFSNKINSIKNDGYNVIINENSITHSEKTKHKFDLFELVKKIDKDINLDNYNEHLSYLYTKLLVQNLLMQNKNITYKEYYKVYSDSFNYLDELLKKKKLKYNFKIVKGEKFIISFFINIFMLFRKTIFIKPILFLMKSI